MSQTHPRFIHFMGIESMVFNSCLIRLVNQTHGGEGGDPDHLFLVALEDTYCEFSGLYANVVHEPQMDLSTIRRYDTEAEILFLHGLFLRNADIRHLSTDQAQRTVWCVWGDDLYALQRRETLSWRFKTWVANRRVAHFRAIAAGYKYDIHEIRSRYGNRVPVYEALYDTGYYNTDIDRIAAGHRRTDLRTNIMIGHCGYRFIQHEKQLERLAAYRNEDIVITLVLSYGPADYIARVEQRARELFPEEQLNIVREFMSWEQFIDILCDVDIAVFDFDHQAAFGNMILLSYLGKKLYLAPEGIMSRGFRAENAEVYDCTEIGRVPFGELKEHPAAGKCDRHYVASLLDKESIGAQWTRLFDAVK